MEGEKSEIEADIVVLILSRNIGECCGGSWTEFEVTLNITVTSFMRRALPLTSFMDENVSDILNKYFLFFLYNKNYVISLQIWQEQS